MAGEEIVARAVEGERQEEVAQTGEEEEGLVDVARVVEWERLAAAVQMKAREGLVNVVRAVEWEKLVAVAQMKA